MKYLKNISLVVAFLFLPYPCSAKKYWKTLEGACTSVHDGDTITLLSPKGKSKIRLLYVDAPELKQPYGEQSRDYLAQQVINKTIKIKYKYKDKYGRTLGELYLKEKLINTELIRTGQAWAYNTTKVNKALQEQAKSAKLGLWQEENPQPPWEYRKRNRK
jgi:endonuclease YncB( thermonuclease family)